MDWWSRTQFSRSHRGLKVLCDWDSKSGPHSYRRDLKVASLCPVTELVNRPDCQSGSDGGRTHTGRQSKGVNVGDSLRRRSDLGPCSSVELEHAATNRSLSGVRISPGAPIEVLMRDSSVVERAAHTRNVGSSILPPATNFNLAVLVLVAMCCQPSIPGVAQGVEHPTDNRKAVSSNLTAWTKRVMDVGTGAVERSASSPGALRDTEVAQMVELRCYIPRVGSSSLSLRTSRVRVTQLAEYQPSKLGVVGSMPTTDSNINRSVGPVAQLGEQMILNHQVAGSIPVRPTSRIVKHAPVAQLVEHLAFNQSVEGSTPFGRTNRGPVAQRKEHLASNQAVESLNLSWPSKSESRRQGRTGSSMVERFPYKRVVTSSILVPSTRRNVLCLETERIRSGGSGSVAQLVERRSPKPGQLKVQLLPGPPPPFWRIGVEHV